MRSPAGTFVGKNLVPTTIGNLIGGSVFVGTAYAASFGAPAHWGEAALAPLGRLSGSTGPLSTALPLAACLWSFRRVLAVCFGGSMKAQLKQHGLIRSPY